MEPKRPSAIERLAAVVDAEIDSCVKEWDRNTCGFHATMIAALCGGEDKMGPNCRDLYDRLMLDADEPPVAHESQIVFAFSQAMLADQQAEAANAD